MTDVSATGATARLLWEVARPEPDLAAVTSAAAAADLDLAARAATAHRVAPLMWRALDRAGLAPELGPPGERLRAEHELQRVRNTMLLPRAVALITEPLRSAGLEPLLYKGATLAERYAEPGLRPMDDIDVILPRRDHAMAVAALERRGWRVHHGGVHDEYDTYLVHPELPSLPLELHWGLSTWRERAVDLDAEELWRRRVPIDVFGQAAFGLRPADELVALAAHAGKPFHQFRRLIWAVDVAVVVETAATPLPWPEVAATAHRTGCETVVAVALHHAHRLGVEPPQAMLTIRGEARRGALAPVLAESWPCTDLTPKLARRLRFALSDARRRQAVLFWAQVTEAGWYDAPRAAVMFTFGAVRQWWRLRRADAA